VRLPLEPGFGRSSSSPQRGASCAQGRPAMSAHAAREALGLPARAGGDQQERHDDPNPDGHARYGSLSSRAVTWALGSPPSTLRPVTAMINSSATSSAVNTT